MAEKNISLANRAYTIIKENIMNLTYPPGMTLTEAKLTKELGMSRSPVRSAIQMLQNEGLIVSDYYKSMMVKEITDEDITEIYQIRELKVRLSSSSSHPADTRNIPIVLRKKSCVCVRLPEISTTGNWQTQPCTGRSSVFLKMNESTASMKII